MLLSVAVYLHLAPPDKLTDGADRNSPDHPIEQVVCRSQSTASGSPSKPQKAIVASNANGACRIRLVISHPAIRLRFDT